MTTLNTSILRVLLLLPLLASFVTSGCAKRAASGSSYPTSVEGGYDGYDDYGGGDVGASYDKEMEIAEDYAPGGGLSSRGRSKHAQMLESRNEFKADEGERSYEESPPEEPPPAPEPVTDGTLEPSVVDVPTEGRPQPTQQAASKRQMIYTATMQVGVYDIAHAIAAAEALPERLGGWLHQRSDNQLILRIPAEKLESAMAEIAERGVVDYRLLEALDVTAQYTDLDSRIKVLEEMQAQLKALLARTTSVEEALEIRKALDGVTLELELARGQIRELAKSIAFSTLVLRFVERGPTVAVPTSNDPFTWVDELGVEIHGVPMHPRSFPPRKPPCPQIKTSTLSRWRSRTLALAAPLDAGLEPRLLQDVRRVVRDERGPGDARGPDHRRDRVRRLRL